MASVAGKGPVEIIFIFCCTHAIYSSLGFKILTEQPGKAERRAFHLCCQGCCLYYLPCFSLRANIKLFQAWTRLCQGRFFQEDKFECELGKEEERLKHYCSWPCGC